MKINFLAFLRKSFKTYFNNNKNSINFLTLTPVLFWIRFSSIFCGKPVEAAASCDKPFPEAFAGVLGTAFSSFSSFWTPPALWRVSECCSVSYIVLYCSLGLLAFGREKTEAVSFSARFVSDWLFVQS